MWEDMPKRMSTGTKILIFILIILVLATLVYVGLLLFRTKPVETDELIISPIPSESLKVSGSPGATSPTPTSASPSPLQNYKVPQGETFINASTGDTNGDGKDETLVITQLANGKYHIYVLSNTGTSLYDNREVTRKPIRIALQTYDSTKESYLSWMLVYVENSAELAFIHWNGTAYEMLTQGM